MILGKDRFILHESWPRPERLKYWSVILTVAETGRQDLTWNQDKSKNRFLVNVVYSTLLETYKVVPTLKFKSCTIPFIVHLRANLLYEPTNHIRTSHGLVFAHHFPLWVPINPSLICVSLRLLLFHLSPSLQLSDNFFLLSISLPSGAVLP